MRELKSCRAREGKDQSHFGFIMGDDFHPELGKLGQDKERCRTTGQAVTIIISPTVCRRDEAGDFSGIPFCTDDAPVPVLLFLLALSRTRAH